MNLEHYIDHIITNKKCFSIIGNNKVSHIGTVSDFSFLLTILNIKNKKLL